MWDHIEFAVGSIETARNFYRPVIEAIGFEEVFFSEDDRAVGFGVSSTVQYLLLTEGKPVEPRMHLCLIARSKDAVAAAYAAALSQGGRDNGAPGYRDHYAPGYYAAFVYDPDGHNLEFLYREPQ
ncbi:VOC family protein [Methylobacterium sp. NEAU 140]|uniref:VOC family protein n=1 Tax=Methylobacterium sp. NEAU 140 TaxID=3064945 RepID=UPI00273391FB|nr:VOC family protein [Methylobacterium sp. NEAU 140]MDP4027287.1 VOC family protein [Methylobacterium sp. NEAU 140]